MQKLFLSLLQHFTPLINTIFWITGKQMEVVTVILKLLIFPASAENTDENIKSMCHANKSLSLNCI